MKFIKKKLYGGRLKELIKPKIKGIAQINILFCNNKVNLFYENNLKLNFLF